MKNQVIKVQTNESIISKLKNAFTSPGCVLSEAMQNARRAGASKVEFSYLDEDALLIVDDGQGISDLADFLTLAGSGWSEEVIQKEGAFGMGSFSMLYYCDRLRVESNGYGFEAYTQDILNGLEISVFQSDVTSGTRIALYGYEISDENNASRIEQTLIRLAKGFPIPVFYDGVELERPYSLDNDKQSFIKTEIGYCAVSEFKKDLANSSNYFRAATGSKSVRLFFQGLPVGRGERSLLSWSNVVHLDESLFEVRMPDRDVLIDHLTQEGKVIAAIRELWRNKLTELKGEMVPADFANKFAHTLKFWGLSEMLNDMDAIPDGVVIQITDVPEIGSELNDNYTTAVSGLTRQELEEKQLRVIFIEDCHGYDYFKVHQYAFHTNALCTNWRSLSLLDDNHWLRKMLVTVEEDDISAEAINTRRHSHYSGYSWFEYEACESFKLSGPLGEVNVVEYCFAEDESKMLIPSKAFSGSDIKVISNYYDENDSFDELACEQDVDRFQALLYLLNESRESGILALIHTIGLRGFELQGQRLQVEFDENGDPERVLLSELDNAA